jgi:hypothetical protein
MLVSYGETQNEHLFDREAESIAREAFRENWRTSRRTGSARHRCLSGFEKEGVEVNEASSNLHSREHCRPTSGDSTLRLARNGRAARIRNRV